MSAEVAAAAIELALGLDPNGLELSLFGGEPLLAREFVEAVTELARRRLHEVAPSANLFIHLHTNATLVDEPWLDFVRRQPSINAFVSLDGPANVHDRHRRMNSQLGSHARARQGILALSQAGARIHALGVVNPDTARDLGVVMREFLELPLFRAQLAPNLRAAWDQAALGNLRQGLSEAMALWANEFRLGRAFHFEPFSSKILSHLHAAMPCPSRCQLLAKELVVAPSGRLYPCGELVGEDTAGAFVVGDVFRGIDREKLARLSAQKNRIEVTCRSCALFDRCASSCGCKHVALTGRLGEATSTLCDLEQLFIEAADELATRLSAEGCLAFEQFFYRNRWLVPGGKALLRRRSSPRVS